MNTQVKCFLIKLHFNISEYGFWLLSCDLSPRKYASTQVFLYFNTFLFQAISLKDNDSLAAMLAAEIQADLLILMSDVDGMYTKPPTQEGARLIHTYNTEMRETIQFGMTSKVGTGGMDSKVNILYNPV